MPWWWPWRRRNNRPATQQSSGQLARKQQDEDTLASTSSDPLEADTEIAPNHEQSSKSSTPGQLRILVVDEIVTSADSFARWLQGLGYEARAAYDGASALMTAQTFAPDIVFIDTAMTGISGLETAQRLRQLPGLGNVLLVAVTTLSSEEDRRRAREVGFDHYLTKPMALGEVRILLAQRAGHHQP